MDRSGAPKLDNREFSREHRLQGKRAPRNTDGFHVKPIFGVKISLLRKPHRHLRRRRGTATDPDPIDLLFLS